MPAPGARTLPSKARVAQERVAGVDVQVDSSAWKWGDVEDVLAPVRVTIHDGTARPLRLTYQEFTLGGPSGFRLAALPPYQVAAQSPTPVDPLWEGDGFLYAPWAVRFYRGGAPWGGPFPYDPDYYDALWGSWPAQLPNQDVLRRALPEGVLQPGGTVSGFLYFQDQPKGTALTFLGTLVDANSGRILGTVAIPFVVK